VSDRLEKHPFNHIKKGNAPAVQKTFADIGMDAMPGTPEQFFTLARAEAGRWGPVIKTTGVKLD
jgi:hypothetical protein